MTLLPPDYGGGSLADVLPAAMTALGHPGFTPGGRLVLPDSRGVVVLLVDGLGWSALQDHARLAPFLTALLGGEHSRRISTVFPSTTPIALTSLGTGLTPGEHGITGLFLRLPDGRRIDTLARPADTDLAALQPKPTVFERAVEVGVAVTRIGPAAFERDGLTDAGLRGGAYAAAGSVGERVAATAAAVRREGGALAYAYYGELDGTGHRHGVDSEAWRAELRHVDRLVEQLAAALPAGTTLVVTADHGMVDVAPGNVVDVAAVPALARGVETLAGDLRGAQVHVRPGAAGDVLAAWQETLGGDFWVVPRGEAVEAGLFGPAVEAAFAARMGEILAVPVTQCTVVDSRWMKPELLSLVGMHGGLSDAELGVPLLVHQT